MISQCIFILTKRYNYIMKTIVFAGGGTAGHVMPNIALIEQLKDKCRCAYIGTNGIEKTLIEKQFGKENFFEGKFHCKIN